MVQRGPFLQLGFSQGSIFRALDKGEILQAEPFNINSYPLFLYEKLADDLAPKHIINWIHASNKAYVPFFVL